MEVVADTSICVRGQAPPGQVAGPPAAATREKSAPDGAECGTTEPMEVVADPSVSGQVPPSKEGTAEAPPAVVKGGPSAAEQCSIEEALGVIVPDTDVNGQVPLGQDRTAKAAPATAKGWQSTVEDCSIEEALEVIPDTIN